MNETAHHQALALYRHLRSAQPAQMERSYLLHVPQLARAWVGGGAAREVTLHRDGLRIRIGDDEEHLDLPDGPRFAALSSRLDPARPCFFMISNDIARAACDPDLPLAVFLQPALEIECRDGKAPTFHGALPGTDAATLLAVAGQQPTEAQAAAPRRPAATRWRSEDDTHFRQRLQQAIDRLQGVAGKMIITRSYVTDLPAGRDPLQLYACYTGFETQPAASHYARLPAGAVSLGCSPENIFEIEAGRLRFDVVASTRGISSDPDEDRRWLQELREDPKEIKEHQMALGRYKARLQGLCDPASVREEQLMGVRQLHCVRHLHSLLSGRLRDDLSALDLIDDSFPPLSSYPAELIPIADPGTEPSYYYGGMVGRLGPGLSEAHCFLNLRAALIKDGIIHTQGGVGVIAESTASRELLEVQNKLRCLMHAVDAWLQPA